MIKKCLGCGVKLQDKDDTSCGYVSSMDKDLCTRCFKIKHYNEYKRVSFNNSDYLKIINGINGSNDLVILVVSLFGMGDLLKLRGLIKRKNVLLLLSKKDIFPKSIKDSKLISYVKKLNLDLLDVIVISSVKDYNIDKVYSAIMNYKNSDKVYIVGITNSGKSTLINKLIARYSLSCEEVTCSMYPNTTLDNIYIKLNDELTLVDTPGLFNEKSIVNYLNVEELKKVSLKNRIKPRIYQLSRPESFIINDMVRVDYLSNTRSSLIFYLSNEAKIVRCGVNNTKLKDKKMYSFKMIANKDIVIDDFFFVCAPKKCDLLVYVNYEVDVYERDRLI